MRRCRDEEAWGGHGAGAFDNGGDFVATAARTAGARARANGPPSRVESRTPVHGGGRPAGSSRVHPCREALHERSSSRCRGAPMPGEPAGLPTRASQAYFADLLCPAAKLAIELEGDSHRGSHRRDRVCDTFFAGRGIAVLRLPNQLVLEQPDAALELILRASRLLPPHAVRGAGGERSQHQGCRARQRRFFQQPSRTRSRLASRRGRSRTSAGWRALRAWHSRRCDRTPAA